MLLSFLLCSVSADDINFISPEQIKELGDSVTFNCTVDNPGKSTVMWSRRDRDRTADSAVILSVAKQMTLHEERIRLNISEDGSVYLLQVSKIIKWIIWRNRFVSYFKIKTFNFRAHVSCLNKIKSVFGYFVNRNNLLKDFIFFRLFFSISYTVKLSIIFFNSKIR